MDGQPLHRTNNFNLLRMLAALAVLVSHAFPQSLGMAAREPLSDVLGLSLGSIAVYAFFAVSGYFVSQSLDRSDGLIDFAVARLLRIYPGLLIVLCLSTFILGPSITGDANYLRNPGTYSYVPANLLLIRLQYSLPGVFATNPYPNTVNGSLWSLFYEAVCYVSLGILPLLGFSRRPRSLLILCIAYASFLMTTRHSDLYQIRQMRELSFPFVIGLTLYRLRPWLDWHPTIAITLGLVAALSWHRSWFPWAFMAFWSYAVLLIGFARIPFLHLYNRLGDYSYGVYIYAFPVGQVVAALRPGVSPAMLAAVALLPTLCLAVISWHGVERRAIAWRPQIVGSAYRWLRVPTPELRSQPPC